MIASSAFRSFFRFGPLSVTLAMAILTLPLAWQLIAPLLSAPIPTNAAYDIPRMLLWYAVLPRMATALIAGACLGLSGALFQQVLRNPLASPTTLGISAGASLALAVTTLFSPVLLGLGRDIVALFGSAAAALLVFMLGSRRGFSPFSLVLAGLVVSLWCGALSAVLVLLNDRYLVSLYIWGSGSLSQQSWSVPLSLLPKLILAAGFAALTFRPLALLELGESSAAALGVRIAYLRFGAVAIALALAAFVTSAVGVIGFVGLVAPTIARLAGARAPGRLLVWSTLVGSALLWLADCGVQIAAGALSDFLPTGSVTAIFGSPILLLLLPRLKIVHRVMMTSSSAARPRLRITPTVICLALVLLALLLTSIVLYGRSPGGEWALLDGTLYADVLPIRLPRVLAAFASGAILATAGTILQRLTGNEMASPEMLGISAGATLGVTASIFLIATPGIFGQFAAASVGAVTVISFLLLTTFRVGLAPERVLLAGIALSAMADAVIGILTASGDPRALFLMRWMGGSTYGMEASTAAAIAVIALILCTAAVLLHRWLDILPLGPETASELGLSLGHSRFVLFGLAGLLTAAATLVVGPISFIGLMAPHLAREAGVVPAKSQLIIAALAGGSLMTLADWAGRTVVFPYQLPAGLISALVGAPFLMLLLRRKV